MNAVAPQGRHHTPAYCVLSGPERYKGRACSGLITSLFFSFLLISSYNHLLARLEDQNSEQIEVYTLFSVNYFISLGLLVGHFKWCVSYWAFYKQLPTLYSRDNFREKKLCDFQFSDKLFMFQLPHSPGTFTIEAAVLGLRLGHFLPQLNLNFAIPSALSEAQPWAWWLSSIDNGTFWKKGKTAESQASHEEKECNPRSKPRKDGHKPPSRGCVQGTQEKRRPGPLFSLTWFSMAGDKGMVGETCNSSDMFDPRMLKTPH